MFRNWPVSGEAAPGDLIVGEDGRFAPVDPTRPSSANSPDAPVTGGDFLWPVAPHDGGALAARLSVAAPLQAAFEQMSLLNFINAFASGLEGAHDAVAPLAPDQAIPFAGVRVIEDDHLHLADAHDAALAGLGATPDAGLVSSLSAGAGAGAPLDSQASANGRFDIVINYTGDAAYASVFQMAKARWEQIIVGDIPDSSYNGQTVDDLLIDANVSYIDGPGAVLGSAGPDWIRSGSALPVHGKMTFDSADMASMASSGILYSVILHEMGHVLGVGTIWQTKGLRTGDSSYYGFTGANALSEYRAMSGAVSATSVPVHPGTISGSSGSHWAESVFQSELLTPYTGPGASMPISRLTVASLADLGYAVNMSAADAYVMPGAAAVAGSVSIDDVSIIEGNAGTKVATFTITRSGGTAAFSVNYVTANGAATAGTDYVAASGALSFAAGVMTRTISVTVNGDVTPEANETFFVNLSGATNGATIADGQGVGTIVNDDAVNRAPVITSNGGGDAAAVLFAENGTGAVATVTATDADGDAISYAIVGGADAARFQIHATTGVLTFIAPPDFESPQDADANNSYIVQVRATDNAASPQSDTQTIAVNVTDIALFGAPVLRLASYAPNKGGWSSDNLYHRELADVDGDGAADIVGFGSEGVYVSRATGGGFADPSFKMAAYGPDAGGWYNQNLYHRELADVNGDGRADIVGFGSEGVYVSLATGAGFAAPSFALSAYGANAGGWYNDNLYKRGLADVNGDGRADIVGFGSEGVYVSLAGPGATFAAPSFVLAAFAPNAGGWTNDDVYHRELGDVDGDGRADIVGFSADGVYVSLAIDGGFAAPARRLSGFGSNSWQSDDTFPRMLADVNGDGRADIVGFGSEGVYVAMATGGGSFENPALHLRDFGAAQGWTSDDLLHRELADVNGDGRADIVGFGADGVHVATTNPFLSF